jgi:arylsulfatase A-like enzyme
LIASDSLPPYTFLWSTALEPNGSYTLAATAFDTSGGSESSAPVNLLVNNVPVSNRPNIVVVVTDDQRWDTMQYMPQINALLYPEAIRFTNATAAVPLCCPSRSTIFSGLYSHNHGIIDNVAPYGGATMFDDSSTIATWLDGRGYRTGLFGKYLNQYNLIAPYVPPGWDEWHAFVGDNSNYYTYDLVENGVTVSYGGDPEDYSTDLLTGKAIDFITTTAPSDPVFVYAAFFAPHYNEDYSGMASFPEPGPGDSGAYASLPPWRPSSFNEADVSDKPTWVKNLPILSADKIATLDQFRIKQLESLLAVDRAIGDLIAALQQTDRYENTVFVFLSDNGLSWGEHRWNWQKKCSYEECVRIPFWIRVPGVSGRDDNSLVNDVDLAPTLAELAGALPSSQPDGFSMLDLIENADSPWRTEAYTEFLSPRIGGSKVVFREVRTEQYMYAEYDNGDREFYDLFIDPLQNLNRVSNPVYAEIVNGLQKLLQLLRNQ